MRKIFKRFASLLTIFILTIMSIVPVHASENTSVVNVTDDWRYRWQNVLQRE